VEDSAEAEIEAMNHGISADNYNDIYDDPWEVEEEEIEEEEE
jgi:hypothetical protein